MRALRCLALIAALVVSAGPARGGPQPPQPSHPPLGRALEGDARVLYEAARDLYKAGDYGSAYAKFQRALELSHDPRLYWNLAACERKAKHNANVLRLIDAYLREGEGWLAEEDEREAKRAAAAVRPFVAAASVKTRPEEGVDIFVDDVHLATTPLGTPLWIDAGARRVRFAKAGYKPVERVEEIQAGSELTWSADLEAEAAAPPPPELGPAADARGARRAPARTVPIVLVAAGGAALVGGGVLTVVTLSDFGSLRQDCGTSCAPSRWQTDRTLQTVGDVLLVTGALALASGVVWWLAAGARPDRASRPLAATGVVF